jgi:hypothetical protein
MRVLGFNGSMSSSKEGEIVRGTVSQCLPQCFQIHVLKMCLMVILSKVENYQNDKSKTECSIIKMKFSGLQE